MPKFKEHKHNTTAYYAHVGDIKNRVPRNIYEVDNITGEQTVISAQYPVAEVAERPPEDCCKYRGPNREGFAPQTPADEAAQGDYQCTHQRAVPGTRAEREAAVVCEIQFKRRQDLDDATSAEPTDGPFLGELIKHHHRCDDNRDQLPLP